jgi:hypothetical protein
MNNSKADPMNRSKNTTQQSVIHLLFATLTVAMSLSLGMSTARGELLFSDSFQYPAGPLAGQGPPPGAPAGQTGWSLLSGDPQVTSMGLHLMHVLSAGGGAILDDNTGAQTVVAGLTPVNSGIVWIGFLIRNVSGGDDGFAVLNLTAGTGTTGFPGYGVLDARQLFGIDNDTGRRGSQAFTTIAPSTNTTWVVIKLNFNNGSQAIHINPMSANSPPDAVLRMTSEFQTNGFSDMRLNQNFNDGVFEFDELRVATTFNEIRNP